MGAGRMHSRPNSEGGCIYSLAGLGGCALCINTTVTSERRRPATPEFAGSILRLKPSGDANTCPKRLAVPTKTQTAEFTYRSFAYYVGRRCRSATIKDVAGD